jgi:hypothetical protein
MVRLFREQQPPGDAAPPFRRASSSPEDQHLLLRSFRASPKPFQAFELCDHESQALKPR